MKPRNIPVQHFAERLRHLNDLIEFTLNLENWENLAATPSPIPRPLAILLPKNLEWDRYDPPISYSLGTHQYLAIPPRIPTH